MNRHTRIPPAATWTWAVFAIVGLLSPLAHVAVAAPSVTTPNQPAPRSGHLVSTVPDGRILIFGGDSPGGGTAVDEDDDTWIWDGTSFQNVSLIGGGYGPAPRTGASMAAGVMAGGLEYGSSASNQTWTWGVSGNFWLQCPGCAYDPGGGQAACGLRLLNSNGALAHAYFSSYGIGDYFATYEHNTGWYAAQSTGTPPPRNAPAMASIGSTKAAIFGPIYQGDPNSTSLIDAPAGTGAWETYTLPGSPTSRFGAVMAAESANGNTYIMFGGHTNDARTWRLTQATPLSASTWEVVATNGPPPRETTGMAYDPTHGTVVLFGGHLYAHGRGTTLGDLWEWTPATNSWARRNCVEPLWLDLTIDTMPPARNGHCLVWDTGRRVAVLFGGRDGAPLGDTWEYDGSTWTLRATTGPTPRFDAAMAYDEAQQEVVLFGGNDGTNLLGDTWAWRDGSWQLRSATGGPSARTGAAMAFDNASSSVTLVGGDAADAFSLCGDTWQWDGTIWTQRGTGGLPIGYFGSGVAYATMSCEPTASRLVLYGGSLGRDGINSQAYLWNQASGTWSVAPLDPASPVPPARSSASLVWNAARGRLLMVGGIDVSSCLDDTWELGFDGLSGQWSWEQLAISGASARAGHAMAYDPLRGGVLLFGGRDGAWSSQADTWCFLGDAMQEIQATNTTQHADPGAPVTLTLQHSGAVLTCTWRHDGVLIPGVTGTTYTIAAATEADAGTYLVKAVGPCSSDATATITLEVSANPPAITTQPVAQTVCDNAPVTLSVAVSGTPPFEYQWWHNPNPPFGSSAPIPGATDATYSLAHAHVGNGGTYWVQVTNAQGMVMSDGVTVTVNPPVAITRQPIGGTRCQGTTFTLQAGASGALPGQSLDWQWIRNGAPIAGANDSTLVVDQNVQNTDTYWAVVSGACGVGISQSAAVTMGFPVVLYNWTPPATVCEGERLRMVVHALAIPQATYSWRKNGVLIPGATDSVLTIEPATAADDAHYEVTVTNQCGTATASANVVVDLRPSIVTQPSGQASCAGALATFGVDVTGTRPITYQWQFNRVNIPGATDSTLTIASPSPADEGMYRVLLANACGDSVASDEAQLTVGSGVTIQYQTPSARACTGENVSFAVTTSGATAYQWRHNAVAIDGATGPSLTLNAVTAADAGLYDVLLTGSCGFSASTIDTLTVDSAASFTQQPAAQTVCDGGPASLAVFATGSPAPSYRWYHNGLELLGQTGSTLVLAATTPAAGVYRAEARTPACGGTFSQRAPLTTACGAAGWMQASSPEPAARAVAALAYDHARGKSILFGGVDDNGAVYYGDTWERNSATGVWTQVATTGPHARQGASLVHDPLRQVTWLYGGHWSDGGSTVYYDDLWKWNGTTWTQVTGLAISPGPRWSHAMAWDADHGCVVLYGGWSGLPGSACSDTWTWNGTTWTLAATAGPGPRALTSMTYDLARGRVVLFGGVDETGQGYLGGPGQKNDTWTWDGVAWSLAATTGPAPRQGHVLCYDNAYNVAIMFGGAGGGALLTDTWSWDGAAWTQLALTGPSPRMYLPSAYDEQNGEVLVFGGFDNSGDWAVGGTWTWSETGGPAAVDEPLPAVSFAGPAQLFPCVPNPFNPRTELRFALAEPLPVTLKIYDLQGRCVRTVTTAEAFAGGEHRVPWDGTSDMGQRLASGVYHLRMTAGRFTGSQRLVLIK